MTMREVGESAGPGRSGRERRPEGSGGEAARAGPRDASCGRAAFPALLVAAALAVPVGPSAAATAPASVSDAPGGRAAANAAPDTAGIHITDVWIPASGDVRLHGRLWRPQPRSEPRATVLSITPYTADDAHEYGTYFARRGYAYLNVDVRGRGSSEGEFRPMRQDGPDGAQVVRWIAEQPWSDGRVVTRGGSYRGMVQWQLMANGPLEPLRTAVPTASVYPGWDYPNPGGIFMSYATRWLSFVQGRASQASLFGDSDYWGARYREMHREGRPFSDLEEITGLSLRSAEIFRRWIEHPRLDDFWRAPSPDSADYRRLDLPLLTVTGHFDGDQPGALRYYRKHMRYGSAAGTDRHYLVVGPWSHGGTRDPESELGGLTFADTAALDMNALHRDWFDWVLREDPRPPFLEDRVMYYVMGDRRWRSAPSLDAVADTSRTLYLRSPEGNPDDPFEPGRLAAGPPERADADRYVYDPRDTADLATLESMEGDYTAPGAAFLDGPKLIYQSPPLEEGIEVSGQMRLDAWIELDVPDTDIVAWVYEIRPTGRTVYMGRSALRARHRYGVDTTALAEPGRVERYRFDRFYWFSRRLKEGSRIRLVVAPLNTPDVQKNYQSGGDPMRESAADARTGTVRVHMSEERPSRLVLPVRTEGGER